MSTKMSSLSISPAGIAPADAAVSPPCAGSIARVAALAARPPGEARPPMPVGGEPEVYCRRLGAHRAAQGYAPCSDLGCEGCTPRHR
jgi:hypothetical protein